LSFDFTNFIYSNNNNGSNNIDNLKIGQGSNSKIKNKKQKNLD